MKPCGVASPLSDQRAATANGQLSAGSRRPGPASGRLAAIGRASARCSCVKGRPRLCNSPGRARVPECQVTGRRAIRTCVWAAMRKNGSGSSDDDGQAEVALRAEAAAGLSAAVAVCGDDGRSRRTGSEEHALRAAAHAGRASAARWRQEPDRTGLTQDGRSRAAVDHPVLAGQDQRYPRAHPDVNGRAVGAITLDEKGGSMVTAGQGGPGAGAAGDESRGCDGTGSRECPAPWRAPGGSLGYALVHCWPECPLQAQSSNWVPFVRLAPGSSRHFPDGGLTHACDFFLQVHRWAALPVHDDSTTLVPLAVLPPLMLRHFPVFTFL